MEAGFLGSSGDKYEKVLYYRRPNSGEHPGWITTGSRSQMENFQLRGFTPLMSYGYIPAPKDTDKGWNKWWHILSQPGGPMEFPAEQILTHRWYEEDENPLPGTVWPQLKGHKVVHYPCPECSRVFQAVDGAGGVQHLASHLRISHEWDRASLITYGQKVDIDFDASYSSLKKSYDFDVEAVAGDTLSCEECGYEPAPGKSAEKALRMHKMSAHKGMAIEGAIEVELPV